MQAIKIDQGWNDVKSISIDTITNTIYLINNHIHKLTFTEENKLHKEILNWEDWTNTNSSTFYEGVLYVNINGKILSVNKSGESDFFFYDGNRQINSNFLIPGEDNNFLAFLYYGIYRISTKAPLFETVEDTDWTNTKAMLYHKGNIYVLFKDSLWSVNSETGEVLEIMKEMKEYHLMAMNEDKIYLLNFENKFKILDLLTQEENEIELEFINNQNEYREIVVMKYLLKNSNGSFYAVSTQGNIYNIILK